MDEKVGHEAKRNMNCFLQLHVTLGGRGDVTTDESTPSWAICFHPTPSLDGTRTLACSLESRRPACALTSGGSGLMSNLSFSKTACPVCLKRRSVSLHDPGGCQLVGLKRRLVILHDQGGCQLVGWKRLVILHDQGGCQLVGLEKVCAAMLGMLRACITLLNAPESI